MDNGLRLSVRRRIIGAMTRPQATTAPGELPARVRLARHRSVLSLGASTRVVGLDPDSALVVEGLPPPLPALLDRLEQPGEEKKKDDE